MRLTLAEKNTLLSALVNAIDYEESLIDSYRVELAQEKQPDGRILIVRKIPKEWEPTVLRCQRRIDAWEALKKKVIRSRVREMATK